MSKYFKLSDFEYSETAIKKGINNKIPKETIPNYEKFMNILDEIRTELGKPIYINSGYRCDKLNKLLGGSNTSDHTYNGAAAGDLDCRDINLNKKLFEIISLKVKLHKLNINEVILEYGGK
jgi:zinc D-Ala-D-Ala carboxypeptidase